MRLLAILSFTLLATASSHEPVVAESGPAIAPQPGTLKITGAIPGNRRKFRVGERVPLEVVIHNSAKTAATLSYPGAWWFCGPSVSATRNGKPVTVRHTELFGSVAVLHEKVAPGGTARIKHAGLFLGTARKDQSQHAPYLEDPAPGKYQIRVEFEARADGLFPQARVALDPPLEIEIVGP